MNVQLTLNYSSPSQFQGVFQITSDYAFSLRLLQPNHLLHCLLLRMTEALGTLPLTLMSRAALPVASQKAPLTRILLMTSLPTPQQQASRRAVGYKAHSPAQTVFGCDGPPPQRALMSKAMVVDGLGYVRLKVK